MKRLPGAKVIVARTVAGYSNLANALIPCASDTESIQRRALLTSLCKLSLPSWGDSDDGIPLEDHHILCLEELFGIIHRHRDALMKDWYIILCTLEYLSRLPISSPSLSESTLRKSSFISSCLARLSQFTTCLSDDSLECFVSSLADVSAIQSEKAFQKKQGSNVAIAPLRSGEDADAVSQQKDSAGMTGRLFSLAGRAFGGGSDPDLKGKRDSFDSSIARARTSKTYDHDYRNAAYVRLAATKTSIRNSVFQELPFCLVTITDVALYNLFRYRDYGPAVGAHLRDLALSSAPSEVRLYAVDSLTNIVTAQVSQSQDIEGMPRSTKIQQNATTLKDFLAVVDGDSVSGDSDMSDETNEEGKVSQADLLCPLCDAVKGADRVEVAEAGLQGIYAVLEGAGHYLANDAWLPLIKCIGALSGFREEEEKEAGRQHKDLTGYPVDRSAPAWSSCSTLGFRCLKLIVDDFLDEIPRAAETRSALLECCAAYGSSQHDVNTSLTSLGMLWTIADQDLTPDALDRVLSKLSLLAFDGRVEVRNCAVNTLFSCVVGLGDSLSPVQWRVCLSETLLGVLEEISSRGSESQNADTDKTTTSGVNPDVQSNRYKVTVHHSRDSSIKQWATTQVLALRGLERVLRQFFPHLLLAAVSTKNAADGAENWLEESWIRILETAYSCAILTGGRDSLDLRVVGADLSVLCAQVSSKAGIAAANSPARVSTNMQVVNGALRSVNPSKKEQSDETKDRKLSDDDAKASALHQARMFRMAFDYVEKLGNNLEHQSIHADEEGSAIYAESTLLQVMTKFSGSLAALYECCKDDEMSPPTLTAQREGASNDLESKLTHVVGVIMKTAIGDPSSKYLTQAQRACLEILQTMSLHGSFIAYEELGERAYCSINPTENSSPGGEDNVAASSVASETLQVECSKVVLELFLSDTTDYSTKLHVFDSILARAIESSIARYDLFIPIVRQGLELITNAVEGESADDADDRDLEDLWRRTLRILSVLLVPSTTESIQSYSYNAEDILSITSLCAEKLPSKFTDDLCDVLALGAESAAKVARNQSEIHVSGDGRDEDVAELRTNGLKIFHACFSGLSESQPNGSLLLSLSETLLREAVDGAAQTASMKQHNSDDASVDIQISLFVCESIRKLPNIEQAAVKLFPWLCKLTRSDSAALRTEAGTVLSSVDMVRVIEEAKAAEERAVMAEAKCKQLRAEVEKLIEENEELKRQAMLGI